MPKSPEETGVYRCEACGNTERFVGTDSEGYPGPEACDCWAQNDDDVECVCTEVLTQPFTVNEHGDVDYGLHSGGYGADIGSYTRIDCAACGALVWTEDAATEEAGDTDPRFGCPKCGSEDIEEINDCTAYYPVTSWNEDGTPDEYGVPEYGDGEVVKGEDRYHCSGCITDFSEPKRLDA